LDVTDFLEHTTLQGFQKSIVRNTE
jgi:hypothetical protein